MSFTYIYNNLFPREQGQNKIIRTWYNTDLIKDTKSFWASGMGQLIHIYTKFFTKSVTVEAKKENILFSKSKYKFIYKNIIFSETKLKWTLNYFISNKYNIRGNNKLCLYKRWHIMI